MNLITKGTASQTISAGDNSTNYQAARDLSITNITYGDFPREFIDQKIEEKLDHIRKCRFFIGFETVDESLKFSTRLSKGDFSKGSPNVRMQALAWCARLLAISPHNNISRSSLDLAVELGGSCPEIDIASAFLLARDNNIPKALSILAAIDSAQSKTAAFMIEVNHEGIDSALKWLETSQIEFQDLDAEGKFFLLGQYFRQQNWIEPKRNVESLEDKDFVDAPVLYHVAGIVHLMEAVPDEYRVAILNQPPFEAPSFRLSSDESSLSARKIAIDLFFKAAEVAEKLECQNAFVIDTEFALWLQLSSPTDSELGRRNLENKLRDPKVSLYFVHLALQFGLKIDLAAVESEIEKRIALNGGITQDAAKARFAIAFTKSSPEEIADYIAIHYEALSNHLDTLAIRYLQIEMYMRGGIQEKAKNIFDSLVAEGISDIDKERLQSIISEPDFTDLVEARKIQFGNTDSLNDLLPLVEELDRRGSWHDLKNYAEILFNRTGNIKDAELYARAISNSGDTSGVLQFFSDNQKLVEQSDTLKLLDSWARYFEGNLIEAIRGLQLIGDQFQSNSRRSLQINMYIAMGDWDSLLLVSTNDFLKMDKSSPEELLGAAEFAFRLRVSHAKELLFAAAAKGWDNSEIMTGAYILASSHGLEGSEEVAGWLERAAQLSASTGPIRKMSLKELIDNKPGWDQKESDISGKLDRGEVPMFLAASAVNRSLMDLVLVPAETNLLEKDPRKRRAIPIYSGSRLAKRIDPKYKAIGFDATSLLLLSVVDLLDKAIEISESIYLPHSTLSWLFDEKSKLAFHQPSKIRDAHKIRDLVIKKQLNQFELQAELDDNLTSQVGEQLAMMISEAEKINGEEDIQCYVIHPYPVHRIASLMEEEVDMSAYSSTMSGCLPIVRKLREKGRITSAEEENAITYLKLVEKSWPHQPEISDGARLYLDDVSVAYFLHLGMLEKLDAAGFCVSISEREMAESNELIAYESVTVLVDEKIEKIRKVLSRGIGSGKIQIDALPREDGEDSVPSLHPSAQIFFMTRRCDAIVVDDRCLNSHSKLSGQESESEILTTLDVLDVLRERNTISIEEYFESRTKLRRAGFLFIPIQVEELVQYLHSAVVKDGNLEETIELRAIRENILKVRMIKVLQLPKESQWLEVTIKNLMNCLKELWKIDSIENDIEVISDWILELLDIRDWANTLGPEVGDNIANNGRGMAVIALIMLQCEASPKIRAAYDSWLESRVLLPIKQQYPELFAWIINWEKNSLAKLVSSDLEGVK